MKKPKGDFVVKETKVLKRKPEDVQSSAMDAKKRKTYRDEDTVLPNRPEKGTAAGEKKKRLIQEKTHLVSEKPLKRSKQIKFQEKTSLLEGRTDGAQDSIDSNLIKKKKNKVKKLLQETDFKEVSSTLESSERTSSGTSNEIKKKKKKSKPFTSAENLVKNDGVPNGAANEMKKKKKKLHKENVDEEASVINADECNQAKKKKKKSKPFTSAENLVKNNGVPNGAANEMKKKKKKLHKENVDEEASVINADECNQAKKKKKKEKNHEKNRHNASVSNVSSVSENLSPSKSHLKQTKNKVNTKNGSNVLLEGKSPYLGKQNKNNSSPTKLASELPKKKMKFMEFIQQKRNVVNEKGTKTGQTTPLRGKALRKRIINISETISKLKNFSNDQASLLLKVTSEGKKNKIQARIKKIKSKIVVLESELAVHQTKAKGKTTEVVKNKVFKGLPEDPLPAKKKEKTVDLKEFLQNQMKASRFRWLNENLYNSSSEEAQGFFKDDPESFKAYHEGYSEQVAKWPVNPLNIIIKELKSLPEDSVVADLGCGEAKLAEALPRLKVHSLDFIAVKPEVIACDMAHCPLLRSSVDVAVFCLSLMGTNVSDFLLEANRILKTGGTMEIAEVESRFESIEDFIGKVQHYGFQLKKKTPMDMFFFLSFTKKQDVVKSKKLPEFELKPCVYKKR